jgi:ATP-dependent DNA helicase RecQ
LLRTYGGIFEHDIKINTVLLAKKLNSDESIITKGLEKLTTDDVIDYRGSHSDLELTFLVPRDDDRTVNRFAKNIIEQNTLKEHQIAQTLSYIENNKVCRSIQLLSYFGEENSVACGKCDVCLQSQQLPNNLKLDKERITQFLSTQNANSRTIQQVLKLENELVLIILKELLEDGILFINNQNQYQLV